MARVLSSVVPGFTALVLLFSCLGVAPKQSNGVAAIEAELTAAVREGFSGAVLIDEGKKLLLDKGYGPGLSFSGSSRFWIASIAKQFTSAAILKCQERRLLSIADPIAKYLPQAPAGKKAITLLQLLTHHSGLPQNYVAEDMEQRDAAVSAILSQPLRSPSGTAFGYSNDNYALAAVIVELVTGERFEDFVQRELFAPAGIRDTGFAGMAGAKLVVAAPSLPARLSKRQWGGIGSGTMYSTTHDLSRWHRALRDGKVLSPSSVDQLFAGRVKIQEGAAALGWFVGTTEKGTRRIFTRGNDAFGANGLIYVYPDRDITVVVLSHAGQKNADTSWSREVLHIIEENLGL